MDAPKPPSSNDRSVRESPNNTIVSRRADDDKSACVENVRIASVVVVGGGGGVLFFGFFAGVAPAARVLVLSLLTVILRDSASAIACARVFTALRMHGLQSLR
jgi:hypothetical protein